MKKLRFILTGLVMSIIVLPVKGELITTLFGNSIEAQSTKQGEKGYKGCHVQQLEEIPAYTFSLYKKNSNSGQACSYNNAGKWTKIHTITSEEAMLRYGIRSRQSINYMAIFIKAEFLVYNLIKPFA